MSEDQQKSHNNQQQSDNQDHMDIINHHYKKIKNYDKELDSEGMFNQCIDQLVQKIYETFEYNWISLKYQDLKLEEEYKKHLHQKIIKVNYLYIFESIFFLIYYIGLANFKDLPTLNDIPIDIMAAGLLLSFTIAYTSYCKKQLMLAYIFNSFYLIFRAKTWELTLEDKNGLLQMIMHWLVSFFILFYFAREVSNQSSQHQNIKDTLGNSNLWNHLVSRNDKAMDQENVNSGLSFYFEAQEDQTQSKKDLQVFFQQVKTGSKCFTVTTIRDMSLWSALERQTNLSKYKTIAFAQAAHEFRNPLNAIINSIDLLKDFIHEATAQKYYSVAKNCSNLMGFLINDILDSCQIESQKLLLNIEKTSIKQVFEECLNILKFKADQKGLNFSFEITESFPAQISIDQNRLRQILINLLSNAIKYTNKGFVKFTAKINNIQKQNFKIIIEDSGVGIEKSEINCLFTEFNKILRKREMNKEGCGLGLTICQKLVEALGGQIHVESEINKGTKFTIDMPIIQLIAETTSSHENADQDNQVQQDQKIEDFKEYSAMTLNQERTIGDIQYSNNYNDDKYNLNNDEVDENVSSIDLNNFVCINRNDLRKQTAKFQFEDRSIFDTSEDNFIENNIKGMLNQQGITNIDKAYDGRDAFQKFTNNFNAISCNNPEFHNPYQLVMLDNQMPLLTGIEVAQKIRETYEVDQHLKLVLLSM
eukprot:403343733